mmetsp:Transcript_50054/g.64134  ORF Transcript_50054/g.64134 Transcript_50054/m.64134 type:complete len:1151 (-) Transcript_50054:283-3735(-)
MASTAKIFIPDANEEWLPALQESRDGDKVNVKLVIEPDQLQLEGNPGVNDHILENVGGTSKVCKPDIKGGGFPLRDDTVFTNEGVLDMTNLNYLHEAAILYNLRTRFFAARPYTYTGDICIAVNPYQWLDIYTEKLRKEYYVMNRTELPPHAYATSSAAFNGIQEGGPCQSILVSGESGAGKTETVKILMAHVAFISAGDDQSVINRILKSNPLLESFGNAKTTRNDNSSRFGKFTELQFDISCRLIGSVSRTYLLEKSRVIHQSSGERNFHIFHQLMSALTEYHPHLSVPNGDLKYIYEHDCKQLIEGKTDAERLGITCNALDLIHVDEASRSIFFGAISAILYLGELIFVERPGDSEKSDLKNEDLLGPIAELLGIDKNVFSISCTERTMRAKDEVYKVPLKHTEAAGAATGFSKELYSRLFDYLVSRINASTSAEESTIHRTIAMLDIFGFEMFKVNSFEQLCINFANEKLQQKFTHDVFKTVQQEYDEEGIAWETITFTDNEATLNLIEARMGIISVLNEECMRPMGNDDAFTSKLTTLHIKHPDFSKPKLNARNNFIVKHYAGSVTYTSDGFLEKNKDMVQEDLVECMRVSENSLVASIFAPPPVVEEAAAESGGGRRSKKGSLNQLTVSTKFKNQLGQLMGTIGATNVQYVRCIKPNPMKSKELFNMKMVVEQLRCAGVIEAIRITREGFPNKIFHREFLDRFSLLAPQVAKRPNEVAASPTKKSTPASPVKVANKVQLSALCTEVLNIVLEGLASKFQVGQTRIYFKGGILEDLEGRRAVVMQQSAVMIQRIARGLHSRFWYKIQKYALTKIQSFIRMLKVCLWYKATLKKIILVENLYRARQARIVTMVLRRFVRARTIQAVVRMFVLRFKFIRHKRAATVIESWARKNIAQAAYIVALAEAKEQAKMENKLAQLQKKFEEEAAHRAKMEAENAKLQERLQSGGTAPAQSGEQQQPMAGSPNTTVVDQSILNESSQMLEFLQKENAKVKEENARLNKEMAKMRREATHLRQSADTAEATMKVLSQHAKALAQAHMKLQSQKEESDSIIKKNVLKEERLNEELQMKHAMYIAEVNARIQDREVMANMVSMAESDPDCPDDLVFKLRDFVDKSAQTGMVDEGDSPSKQGTAARRMTMMFKGLFD